MSLNDDLVVAIVDYRLNNLLSIRSALEHVTPGEVIVARSPQEASRATHLVLPGVGSFGQGMRNLRAVGWDHALKEMCGVERKPILGICLGMQLLAHSSQESPGARGLGLLEGTVVRLSSAQGRVPHIGWNEVDWRPSSAPSLFRGLESGHDCYFVHSYHFHAGDVEDVAATTPFGHDAIVSAVRRDNVVGLQFHPEKSSATGLRLLRNFVMD